MKISYWLVLIVLLVGCSNNNEAKKPEEAPDISALKEDFNEIKKSWDDKQISPQKALVGLGEILEELQEDPTPPGSNTEIESFTVMVTNLVKEIKKEEGLIGFNPRLFFF